MLVSLGGLAAFVARRSHAMTDGLDSDGLDSDGLDSDGLESEISLMPRHPCSTPQLLDAISGVEDQRRSCTDVVISSGFL